MTNNLLSSQAGAKKSRQCSAPRLCCTVHRHFYNQTHLARPAVWVSSVQCLRSHFFLPCARPPFIARSVLLRRNGLTFGAARILATGCELPVCRNQGWASVLNEMTEECGWFVNLARSCLSSFLPCTTHFHTSSYFERYIIAVSLFSYRFQFTESRHSKKNAELRHTFSEHPLSTTLTLLEKQHAMVQGSGS